MAEKYEKNKKESEKKECFSKILLWNLDGKQSKVNEAEVKVIFVVKNTQYKIA